MKHLVVNSEIREWSQECEIFAGKGFGFNVTFVFGPGSVLEPEGYVETVHNCDEFHHLYKPGYSAIESDIHCNGGTRSHEHLLCIIVTTATRMHNEYNLLTIN